MNIPKFKFKPRQQIHLINNKYASTHIMYQLLCISIDDEGKTMSEKWYRIRDGRNFTDVAEWEIEAHVGGEG
ncbi:MAG: hypothetical protein NUW09_03915, partial [Deltaproteobacteria bacterium]|nr:hypothetical protein [Deltaproteobacteria bacterium]